jgi:hypothetical protein
VPPTAAGQVAESRLLGLIAGAHFPYRLKAKERNAVSTVVFVIIGAVVVGAAISLYLWSRWSEREAAYEPEQLSEEEAAIYRLGTHLGWDGNIAGGNG